MAIWCPVTEEKVLYLECNECEEKRACKMGLLVQEEEKKEEINLEKEPNEEKEDGELF